MWLVKSPGANRADSIVVEISPRVRAKKKRWTYDDDLTTIAAKKYPVRIYGFLMFDGQHPEQLTKTRATLWEVHQPDLEATLDMCDIIVVVLATQLCLADLCNELMGNKRRDCRLRQRLLCMNCNTIVTVLATEEGLAGHRRTQNKLFSENCGTST